MTSSVFFKFKSQREPSRVSFDGTGISVFELKREIINKSRLGDGSDFELAIYNEDTNEEYDDDTSIIPRSTSIIARRLPAARPGKGGAARYISGKMPLGARSSYRPEPSTDSRNGKPADPSSGLDSTRSEDERIKALFNLQESQWREQQEEMSTAIPVATGRGRGKPTNVPDHPPPPGYLCYRCREKGHWIQACPTNNDPNFDGRYRVKRSTGIPRSFQKQVEKPEALTVDGLNDSSKLSGVMVNADGDFVIAQPDKASWELYREKIKASGKSAADLSGAEEIAELQRQGLLCPLDKRVLLAPTKTPCCKTTYCNDCISNALIESDFVCPSCGAEAVLLDDLSVDESAIASLKEYEAEKSSRGRDEPQESKQTDPSRPAEPSTSSPLPNPVSTEEAKAPNKRRAAEAVEKDEERDVGAPTQIKKQKSQDRPTNIPGSHPQALSMFPSAQFDQAPFGNVGASMNPPMSSNLSNGSQFVPFPGNATMTNPFPLIPGGEYSQPATWDQSINTGFMPPQNAPYSNNLGASSGPPFGGTSNGMGGPYFVGHGSQPTMAPFSNQQRTAFGAPFVNEEDNAYFRQPVNPHRHQARQRRVRPSDYREL